MAKSDANIHHDCCKGDFPFLFEYKVEQDVDFVFIKGAN